MLDRKGKGAVYVAAHRGDWREAPENSLRALLLAEQQGVDIVEFDLKKTRDGKLVVMHDATLDRTTTGTGLVSDHTLDEIEHLRLRSGTGHPTAYKVPTFAEELVAARGRVVLNIDQGWNYVPDVLRELSAAGMTDQVILNASPNTPYGEFVARQGPIPDNLTLMIVLNLARPDAQAIIDSYRAHPRTILQCLFADDGLPAVQHLDEGDKHFPLWVNSLWPELNGGHDDDRAVDQGQPEESWGWLIARGARILQTDRPRELMAYLRRKKLHPL